MQFKLNMIGRETDLLQLGHSGNLRDYVCTHT